MYGPWLSRNLDLVAYAPAEETQMQSFHTAAVVSQIIEDRVESATRARRSPRRRRFLSRVQRDSAPLSTTGRLRVSGAGR
jgi:hypothetical protein